MKILHVIPGLANSSGPSQVVSHLVREACASGHECSLYYATGRNADCEVTIHPDCDVQGFPALGLKKWGYSPEMKRAVLSKVPNCDIVHCHSMWLYPTMIAARTAYRAGVPYIIRPAGSLEPWCVRGLKKQLYLKLIERTILDRASAIHAVSQQEANNVKSFGFRAPAVVVPNGVDIAESGPSRSEARRLLGLPEDRPIVLFLSRIHEKKGLDVLGEAMLDVRKRLPAAMVAVAGPDSHEYAKKIKQLYKDLGIIDATRFLGEVSGELKQAAYRAADVFALPTHSENFGVVVLEALAEGTPVVVSKNAPWAAVEERRAGFWIENTPSALSHAVTTILSNPDLHEEMSRNAKDFVIEQFSWASIGRSIEQMYQQIIARSQTSIEIA